MKDVKEISRRQLVEAIQSFNSLEIMEPIEIPGNWKTASKKVIERLRDEFVEAIESLTEDEEELLPENVILMYNFLVEDEVNGERDSEDEEVRVEESEPVTEVQNEKEDLKKESRKKESNEKKAFLEELIGAGKYKVSEIAEMYVEKFGGSINTVKTYIYDGKNPKYNRFSKLVKIENGIVKFVD